MGKLKVIHTELWSSRNQL